MAKSGKISSIHVVRAILDFCLFTGGTAFCLGLLLTIVTSLLIGRSPYFSTSMWPVSITPVGHGSLPHSQMVLIQLPAHRISAFVKPTGTYLQFIGSKDLILLGFDGAWQILTFGTMLVIVYFLRKIFLRMEDGDFFDTHNPARLRVIGWMIIGASVLRTIVTYLYGLYATALIHNLTSSSSAAASGAANPPVSMITSAVIDVSFEQLFIGVVVLALAFVFQHGLALKQEQALTV